MPELPEVEIIKNFIANHIIDMTIANVIVLNHRLRYQIPEDIILAESCRVVTVQRRAKFIQIFLSTAKVIIIHLGMSGSLLIKDQDYEPEKHDHILFSFTSDAMLVYSDPRRFGFIDIIDSSDIHEYKFFINLGIEPLSEALNFDILSSMLVKSKLNIKSFLMNSAFIVGIGNIYANEILFESNIHPLQLVYKLCNNNIVVLLNNIKLVLLKAINLGGSSIQNFVTPYGDKGNFNTGFKVYARDKKNCFVCSNIIEKIIIQQRSTFFCPTCQVL